MSKFPSGEKGVAPVRRFPQTRWSLVLAVQQQGEDAEKALSELCQLYWEPIYWHIRIHRGKTHEDAADLTQGFFEMLLGRGDFMKPVQERGRLRTFLLGALKHFMISEWQWKHAIKRGAGAIHIPIEELQLDHEARLRSAENSDNLYDVHWALSIFRRAEQQLRESYHRENRDGELDLLMQMMVPNARQVPCAMLAEKLGVTEVSARVTACRHRRRMIKLMREMILDTVVSPAEVKSEFEYLMQLLGVQREVYEPTLVRETG